MEAMQPDTTRPSPARHPSVARFVATRRGLLIDGDWRDSASGSSIDVVDPATGEVFAQCASAESTDIDRAVAAARTAFESGVWTQLTPAARARVLWAIAERIEAHADELAEINTLENGKPITASRTGDIRAAAETWRYYAGWCTKIEGRTLPVSVPAREVHAYARREPIGVVGQIVPWNGPMVAMAWKLAPALAAGCTSVFKPAENTPLTALRIGELMLEAGVPAGVVNIVPGLGAVAGAALAAHPGIDKIAFTGSTEVGRRIVQVAAGNLKKVALELGGKSPVIVFADADIEQAIPAAARAIFFNAGQVCIAGSRLYVEAPVFERVLEGIAEFGRKLKIGPGLYPDTEMGPLISATQLQRVCEYIDSGRRAGATVVSGGNRLGGRGYFLEPTVLADVRPDMRVVREEIFGPVLCATRFEDPAGILEPANATRYGLAASIWTRDLRRAHSLAARLRAGLVWINCHGIPDPAMPFGGFKESGWGRELGWEGLEQYTELKSVFTML